MDPVSLFYFVLIFFWIIYIIQTYAHIRQHKVYKKYSTLPDNLRHITDDETFHKSRLYKLDSSGFSLIHGLYGQIEFSLILFFGILPCFWHWTGDLFVTIWGSGSFLDHEILHTLLFVFLSILITTILELPWDIYGTFVIEQKHGFNKQTPRFYIVDQIKKLILTFVLALPIIAGIVWIIKSTGPLFFIYVWAFLFGVQMFIVAIYHPLIAPLFDRYAPLPDGDLKSAIEALARSIHFPLSKLQVVEGSKRSAHSNAYFFGFWKSKRVVLFDTLIEGFQFPDADSKSKEAKNTEKKDETSENPQISSGEKSEKESQAEAPKESSSGAQSKPKGCKQEEILAVLGHEFGHWKYSHFLLLLTFQQVNFFLMLAAFAYLGNNDLIYEAFGFDKATLGKPTLIGLVIVFEFIFAPYNTALSFLLTAVTRRCEFAADRFAGASAPSGLGRSTSLGTALVKLHRDNLSFPIYDWFYSALFHDHPTLLERLEAIKKLE